MNYRAHWDKVYSKKGHDKVGWYKPHLNMSLELIQRTGVSKESSIIDVGGGASTLVNDLLDCGFKHVAVLDLSPTALSILKSRLRAPGEDVEWIEGDITRVTLRENFYDIWHDRAVFHFLTKLEDRTKYVSAMRHALKRGAHIIMATFSPKAPPKCSGLDVVRYTPDQLSAELGEEFKLKDDKRELHITPGGVKQEYTYCLFRKIVQAG